MKKIFVEKSPLGIELQRLPALHHLHDLDVPLLEVFHRHGEGVQFGGHGVQVPRPPRGLVHHLLEPAKIKLLAKIK